MMPIEKRNSDTLSRTIAKCTISIEEVKKSVQSALAEKTRPSIINVLIEPSSGRVQQVC